MTLLHEMERGTVADIGGIEYVWPPDARRSVLLPKHIDLIKEQDGTQTLSGPLDVTTHEGVFVYYLIHGNWTRHRIGR